MNAFEEFCEVRQRPEEGHRRFFSTPYFDLMVWYRSDKTTITGFQLCYDKGRSERAITYKIDEGAGVRSHRFVAGNQADERSSIKTSILAGDAGSLAPSVIERFGMEASSLETSIIKFIEDGMRRFPVSANTR